MIDLLIRQINEECVFLSLNTLNLRKEATTLELLQFIRTLLIYMKQQWENGIIQNNRLIREKNFCVQQFSKRITFLQKQRDKYKAQISQLYISNDHYNQYNKSNRENNHKSTHSNKKQHLAVYNEKYKCHSYSNKDVKKSIVVKNKQIIQQLNIESLKKYCQQIQQKYKKIFKQNSILKQQLNRRKFSFQCPFQNHSSTKESFLSYENVIQIASKVKQILDKQ